MPTGPEALQQLPPDAASQLSPLLRALWHAARNDWDAAHQLAQDIDTPDGAWVHAWLHRHEGDLANAGYWYRRAGKPIATGSLSQEWITIASDLLRSHR